MAKLVVIVCVLVAMLMKQGEAVRCWSCSSDLDSNCLDPFLAGRPENTYRYVMTNCDANAGASYPYLTTSKSVCKKHKKYVNGQLQIIRGCTWKRSDDYSNMCPSTASSRYDSTSFCETCDYDGCNSAPATSAIVALLAATSALAALLR